jgi:RimJ/RimL family protein N-acetyltransferase
MALQRLQTRRLLLRAITLDDVSVVATMQMDPEVMAFYGNGQPLDEIAARETVTKYHVVCREHDYWAWAVTYLETGEVLGQVTAGYSEIDGPRTIELGFILKAAAWGYGYGSEAVKAVIDHGRSMLGWTKIAAGVASRNIRSIRLCEKVGMVHVRNTPGRLGDTRMIFVV